MRKIKSKVMELLTANNLVKKDRACTVAWEAYQTACEADTSPSYASADEATCIAHSAWSIARAAYVQALAEHEAVLGEIENG